MLLGKQTLSTESSSSSWVTDARGSLQAPLAHAHQDHAPKRSLILVFDNISVDQEHPGPPKAFVIPVC